MNAATAGHLAGLIWSLAIIAGIAYVALEGPVRDVLAERQLRRHLEDVAR